MLLWCSATVYLIICCIFLSFWVQGKKPSIVQLAAGVVCASLSVAMVDGTQSLRFSAAVCFGSVGYFSTGLFLDRKYQFQKIVTMLTFIAPITPLIRCDDVNWEYCIVAVCLLACLLMGLIDRLLHGELRAATEQYTAKKYDIPLNLIPLLCVPCAYFLCIEKSRISFPVAAGYCGILFLISALLLILQDQIRQRIKAQIINRALRQWQQESRDYMNTIRSQRHDFNLHLHAISGLVCSGEYAECSEYVRKLVAEAAAVNDIMPVADAVVGSMLYNMREHARRKGSDITYHITYDMEDVVCSGFECNKIIGNLLQNAIDALQTPEDIACGIHANIFKRRGYTVITVENRFTGDKDSIAKVFESGYSTKQRHDGIGLPMVLRTVEQYAGRVYPEFEGDKIRFVVNIPNRLNSKEASL